MRLAGVDLAWQTEKNTTAIAFGELVDNTLFVESVKPSLCTLQQITAELLVEEPKGISIDASLIINNVSGQRPCEKQLSSLFGSRKVSCHASNLTLYPDPASVRLSEALASQGYEHLGRDGGQWQIECYPHPAIIEFFQLEERHLYKKGRVQEKRVGQAELATMIQSFRSPAFNLQFHPEVNSFLDPSRIQQLKGKALKQNEDALDSIICLMVAAHYASDLPYYPIHGHEHGYIYVPKGNA